jgi:hypothetical protein
VSTSGLFDAETHRNKNGGYFRQDLGNRMLFAEGKLARQSDQSHERGCVFVFFLFERGLSPADLFIDKP